MLEARTNTPELLRQSFAITDPVEAARAAEAEAKTEEITATVKVAPPVDAEKARVAAEAAKEVA